MPGCNTLVVECNSTPIPYDTRWSALWDVAFFSVAVVKFFHSVLSSWVLGAIVVKGISCYYLLRKRRKRFAVESIKLQDRWGLVASIVVTALTVT